MAEIEDVIDNAFEKFERVGLNIAGYIPFISIFSGGLRIAFGKLEVIGAVATSAFLALKALFNPDREEKQRL